MNPILKIEENIEAVNWKLIYSKVLSFHIISYHIISCHILKLVGE
jgi:hypothetical protein